MEILTSIHGRKAGLGPDGGLILPDGGVTTGQHGSQLETPGPSRFVLLDDFIGDAIATHMWGNPTKGTEITTVDFAHLTGVSGLLRGTTGAGAGASMAANGIQLHSALQWQVNSTPLPRKTVFQTRLRLSAITNICVFAGFTDQIAALEMPFTIAGNTLTSNATDAVGFLFDTAATTANVKLVGVKNDVDAVHQDSANAPVAATFITLRVEVDVNERATFFINGKQVGSLMSLAVAKTVPLTPVIAAFTRSAASANIDLDYVHCAQDRA